MEYQKVLLKRLLEMIEDNEKEKIYFERAKKKMPSMFFTFDAEYQQAWNNLSKDEQRAYWNNGMRHSKASLKRVRIELNKAMIEKEKNGI